MAFEKFFPNSRSEYNEGILLQEYNGKWYLIDARKPDGDGTVYKSAGYKLFKKKPIERDGEPLVFPWSVCIGHDLSQAKSFLNAVIGQLPGETPDEPPF